MIFFSPARYRIIQSGRMSFKKTLLFHRVRCFCLITNLSSCSPQIRPLGKNALVERHAHRIHLVDGSVEMGFEIPMRAERFANVARSSVFCMELNRFEVVYVVCIRKRTEEIEF